MADNKSQEDRLNSIVGRHLIGSCFRCGEGTHVFYCDSYDPNLGFWLTRADAPLEHLRDEDTDWRRNISVYAVGRTFHIIYNDEDDVMPHSVWGPVDREKLIIPPFDKLDQEAQSPQP